MHYARYHSISAYVITDEALCKVSFKTLLCNGSPRPVLLSYPFLSGCSETIIILRRQLRLSPPCRLSVEGSIADFLFFNALILYSVIVEIHWDDITTLTKSMSIRFYSDTRFEHSLWNHYPLIYLGKKILIYILFVYRTSINDSHPKIVDINTLLIFRLFWLLCSIYVPFNAWILGSAGDLLLKTEASIYCPTW